MTDDSHTEARGPVAEPAALILEIDRRADGSPMRFAAIIRNLAAGVATLQVNNPWAVLNWETLKGRGASIHLPSGTEKGTEIQGTVTWARYTVQGQDSGQLGVGLKLINLDASAQKMLFEHIPHTTEDIKCLWERLDQVRRSPEPAVFSPRLAFAVALALLLGGVALQLAWPKPYKLFGWVLWFFGTLVVAGQTLHFWKSRKASR